jgi:hypothetical protein
MAAMNRSGEIVLLGCVVFFGIVFLISLKGVPFQAQLFPLIVMAALLPLSLARLLVVALSKPPTMVTPAFAPQKRLGAAAGAFVSVERRTSAVAVWIWAAGAAAAMLVLGLVWGTGLSVFVYLSVYSRARWYVSLGVAAVVTAFIFVVFTKLMAIDLTSTLRW